MPRAKSLSGSAQEVEQAFYDALNQGDLDSLMELWAEDEEIVCVHPGGPRLLGHAAIRASWERVLAAGGLEIRPSRLHEIHNLMTAIHSVVEGVSSPGPEPAHLIATNVYIETPRGWRIVAHHVSVAPGPVPAGVDVISNLH